MHGFSPDVPGRSCSPSAEALVLNGSGDELIFDRERTVGSLERRARSPASGKSFWTNQLRERKSRINSPRMSRLAPCDACGGTRWSFQARALRVGGHGIAEILAMTFAEVEKFAGPLGDFAKGTPSENRSLVEAIRRHAHSIVSVGSGYLTGDRGMLDVSEGESRRIRLARVLDAEGERYVSSARRASSRAP